MYVRSIYESQQKQMLMNCISSICGQYIINSEGQCFSKGHHYKHSLSVFLSIQPYISLVDLSPSFQDHSTL